MNLRSEALQPFEALVVVTWASLCQVRQMRECHLFLLMSRLYLVLADWELWYLCQ